MAQNLPKLPDWEQVSTNIIRILGGNPGKFTLQGTNTYLLGRGQQRLLIDTGQGENKWVDTLREVLRTQSPQPATVSTCLLSHWHHDHLGGVKDLESLCADEGTELQVYKNQPSLNPDRLIDPDRVLEIVDGQHFIASSESEPDFEIEAIHTPGHAKDHMSFLITSSSDPSEIGAMFTADNVLGHGTAVFEDLGLYLESLALMKQRVAASIAVQNTAGKTRRAYPGHGAVIEDAVSKIDEYITHRRMREEEALNVLRYGTAKNPDAPSQSVVRDSLTTVGESDSESEMGVGGKEVAAGKAWTSMEMVKVIYRHYPENLYQPAEFGLLMVLEKLRRDGKVVKTSEGKWRMGEKATL
ncbi:uncharacterized protein Z518_10018 [Rhinocladiella mackenziei CBS 650.93]|uniref:Rhinocladiella mackenziei CBS 650.93 unplaced genomic scaffold supercont1.8, whole genome shotgun sequence n=1 Tax=Rhinocladiella mackenziei CBS 650.93 TaxID=1442369 RepID=A0A0D2FG29_9EURO|nr:uncharacterized protein Z518_10018 [Rhinocladiella mackenziei CBS 650.93]KIX00952.1 hypothetical protein Z518_10018 [Rhinocladiella mackenziei CBS 650.93]